MALEHELAVCCTIEPDIRHLIGSHVQSISFRRCPSPHRYFLCVVDHANGVSAQFVGWGRELGAACESRAPCSRNRYLNKFLVLEAFKEELKGRKIALLDWDVIYTGHEPIPTPSDPVIAARPNPSDLYAHVLSSGPLAELAGVRGCAGELHSSVNSGVLIGSLEALFRCAARTDWFATVVGTSAVSCPEWMQEQLALSLALQETGFVRLEDSWNVTATSSVRDYHTQLWHYNDGAELTRVLKKRLNRPSEVGAILGQLEARWANPVAVFRGSYDPAIAAPPLARFVTA